MSTFPDMPTSDPTIKRPGKTGYLIGSLLIVVGIIAGVVLLVVGISSAVDAFRFPKEVASGNSVELSTSGNYIVYEILPVDLSENGSGSVGTSGNSARATISASSVSVTSPSGSVVALGSYDSGRSTSRDFRTAVAVATFHADETGAYRVSATGLAAGHTLGVGTGKKVRTDAFGFSALAGGGGTLAGIIVLIVTAVRRSKSKPMMLPGAPFGAGMPPGPAGGPWMPQPGYGQQFQPGYPPQPGYGQPPQPTYPPYGSPGSPPSPGGQPPPEWSPQAPPTPPPDDPNQSGWAGPS